MAKHFKGFSLIEVLIVTVLMSGSFVVFYYALNQGKTVQAKSQLRTIQAILLNHKINEIRSRNFDENSSAPWSSTLGPDTGDSFYDDVDDYHNQAVTNFTEYPSYSCSTKVDYVSPATGFHTPAGGITDYKRVTVTIFHRTLSAMLDTFIVSPAS